MTLNVIGSTFVKKVKIAFINPPHADWCLPQIITFLSMQSHYDRVGKYPNSVEWIEPPYKWNTYKTISSVYKEINQADIVLFSSYVWNKSIIDELAIHIKKTKPETITVLGGPHIGFNTPTFKTERWMYDFVAIPTTPGELFITDLLNHVISNKSPPKPEDVCFEVRSVKKSNWEFLNFSLYEEHFDFLKKMASYAEEHQLEKFTILETTRGCPYKCVYCEWGGGTGTKVIRKDLDIVKRDITALKLAGYHDVYSTDANFGIFEQRDKEILLFASAIGIKLTDISVVKAKNLERRKRIVDMFHEAGISWDLHIPIQSISNTAMEVASRTDLSLQGKIELGKYIKQKAISHGYERPGVEMIMGMPGVVLEDFYKEYELLLDFEALSDHRYDYMVLPDSEAASLAYITQHKIVLVDVYSDNIDEDNVSNVGPLYKHRKSYFQTISSCFSYTMEEMCEMFFMNYAAPTLVSNHYNVLNQHTNIVLFLKTCFLVVSQLDDFSPIWDEICDIFNPRTPPKNINMLNKKVRVDAISDMLNNNRLEITSNLFHQLNEDI